MSNKLDTVKLNNLVKNLTETLTIKELEYIEFQLSSYVLDNDIMKNWKSADDHLWVDDDNMECD